MKQELKKYTLEDIDDLKKWFEEQKEKIPETMQITSGIYSPNLKATIQMLLEQATIHYANKNMIGNILLLEQIKQNIEKKEEQ